MNRLERQVLDAIDVEGMLSFLCRLIAVPSLGGDESAAQRLVAAQMERSGLEVDLWQIDLDRLRQHPIHCEEIARHEALGVVGTLAGDTKHHDLILNGHVDVVPTGDPDKWTYPPWQGTLTDRRIYGRGSADMKGGLCCALFAAKALRDAGVDLAGNLYIQSVVGEEDGGTGTLATLERGYRAEGAILMEPTDLEVMPCQAGALNFRLTVPGQAAHGSMREEGTSAIEKFLPIFDALRELERTRNAGIDHPLMARHPLPYPLSVGTLRAGNWPSSVPEELICEGRYGVAIDEDPAMGREQLEATVSAAAGTDPWLSEHPPVVEWWGGQFDSCETPSNDPLVVTIGSAIQSLTGSDPRIGGVTYGSDMRLLVNEGGIPSVLFGPGDVRLAHQTDEYVPIDDLILATRALALVAMRFCGVVQHPNPEE